jgi:hypothetical protein
MAVGRPSLLSVAGQTEKNSARAYIFRFALKLGHPVKCLFEIVRYQADANTAAPVPDGNQIGANAPLPIGPPPN